MADDKAAYDKQMRAVQSAHGIKVKAHLDAAEMIHTAQQDKPAVNLGKAAVLPKYNDPKFKGGAESVRTDPKIKSEIMRNIAHQEKMAAKPKK